MYSEIWKKKPEYLKVWIYLLIHVNHQTNRVFPRGSNFFNVPEISKETGVGVNTVYNSIEWLKKAKQITTQKTTRGIVVNVLQYEQYQDPSNYKGETKGETKGEISTKQVRNGYDTINNNDNNDNNDNKDIYMSDPEKSEGKKAKKNELFLDDSFEMKASMFLFEKCKEKNPFIKTPNFQSWAKDIGLMIRVDGISKAYIMRMIEWAKNHERFWSKNILSTSSLRKHFAKMYEEARSEHYKQTQAPPQEKSYGYDMRTNKPLFTD